MDKLTANDGISAGLITGSGDAERLNVMGKYIVQCFDSEGNLKWEDEIINLVTTIGKNSLIDKFLDLSSAHTNIFMGLKGTGTAVIADTMSSHASWNEVGTANAPTYTSPRKTPAFSAASSGSKATSAASSFAITSSGTVAGCFIVMSGTSAIDNTTGTLFSAGDFTGGNKTVANGDTLNVSYSLAV